MNKEKSIEVEKGILDKPLQSSSTVTRDQFTQLKAINGVGKAGELFRFLAKNSDVEWGHITIGHNGGKETQTTIVTNHNERTVPRLAALVDSYLDQASKTDLTIIEATHSHPDASSTWPSGFYPGGALVEPITGDRFMARYIESNYNKNPVRIGLYNDTTGNHTYYSSTKIYYQEVQ